MVDLLCDLSEDSLPASGPANSQQGLLSDVNTIKPSSESYFDLIGLNKSASQHSISSNKAPSSARPLLGTSGACNLESLLNDDGGNHSNSTTRSASPYKDDLLESMLGDLPPAPVLPQVATPLQPPTTLSLHQVIRVDKPDEAKQSVVGILITEPANEKDDDNIVPDGYFNMRHEAPKDQSRPHSPVSTPASSSQSDFRYSMPALPAASAPRPPIPPQPTTTAGQQETASSVAVSSSTATATTSSRATPATPRKVYSTGVNTYNAATMSRARPRPASRGPSPPPLSHQSDLMSVFASEGGAASGGADAHSQKYSSNAELNDLERSMASILDTATGGSAMMAGCGKKPKKNKVSKL
jgi:hypothetical protein